MTTIANSNIFRYNGDGPIVNLINEFLTIHKDDEAGQFREEWDKFIKDNKASIDREKDRLTKLGYTGDKNNKIYKSARYYFKDKPTEKKKTRQRRKYVRLDKGFLADMDRHISTVAFEQNMKPAHAYNNFVSDASYSEKLDGEMQKLLDKGLKEPAAESTIKKAYKNRYFIQQKSSNKD